MSPNLINMTMAYTGDENSDMAQDDEVEINIYTGVYPELAYFM